MSEIETNEPAFPRTYNGDGHNGMTLRDYFAAKAMPAELARWSEGHPNGRDGIAAGCYAVADAMLAARSKA